ncbi:MAG TPA: GH1 family beta-glucosidase [Polyangiaceae bacterium]|nr:GH1 family beta-glucosidase [Polyangiaceae bacterium]
MFSVERNEFGADFVFGVATAAYQIEGGQVEGRGSSIWDSFAATPGNTKNGESGRVACDHYGRWREDLDLIRDGGFDAYRFSFAWPRLIPEGTGSANPHGLSFYDRLIDGMLERGIRPFATLYHWDLPSALQDRGGWMNRDVAGWFADYAALVARHFGDRLASVATLNEPWCSAYLGHLTGRHAPGYRDLRAAARAMHHVLFAHGTAIDALRAAGTQRLGIVTVLKHMQPASNSAEDAAATRIEDALFNRWYMDGLFKGQYPEDLLRILEPHLPAGWQADLPIVSRPLDWLGINYYTRQICAFDASLPLWQSKRVVGELEKNDLGWEIYPEGLTQVLTRAAREYTRLPIYVTENGITEGDDTRRVKFYADHLLALREAQRAGVDIRGYFAWSLLDNYEWAEGYTPRFGIVHTDYATQKRTPKGSYRAFQQLLGAHAPEAKSPEGAGWKR